ncbi:MAG: hypothetical protein RLZZ519_1938 [Bacteroidota bacterium]|jgi:hypothetical protein
MNARRVLPGLLALILLLLGCEKKVLEIFPVIESDDRSIADTSAVLSIDFMDESLGLAGTSTGIYKTTNGGHTWEQGNVGTGKMFVDVDLYDANHGVASGRDQFDRRTVFVTQDGGATWIDKGQYSIIGFMQNGTIVRADYSQGACDMQKSTNFGNTWSFLGSTTFFGGFDYLDGKIQDDKIYFFTDDDLFDRRILAYDLVNTEDYWVDLPSSGTVYPLHDIYKGSDGYYFSGDNCTNITARGSRGLLEQTRHGYDYHAVDGYGGLVVFAGEKTLATNMDFGDSENYLHELYNVDLNGFDATFYDIQFINDSLMWLAGSNGLVWRASL